MTRKPYVKKMGTNLVTIAFGILALVIAYGLYARYSRKDAAALATIYSMDSFLQKETFHFDGVSDCENSNAPYKLMFFYMENCPHCVDFKPVWAKFVERVKTNGVASKLCTTEISAENDDLLTKYDVRSFPTVLLASTNSDDTEMPLRYDGERTETGLLTFISRNIV